MVLKRVVFPVPFLPTNPTRMRGVMEKLKLSISIFAFMRMVRPWNSIIVNQEISVELKLGESWV